MKIVENSLSYFNENNSYPNLLISYNYYNFQYHYRDLLTHSSNQVYSAISIITTI